MDRRLAEAGVGDGMTNGYTAEERAALTMATAVRVVSALTPSERTGVRFGIFPRVAMEAAEQELTDVWPNPVTRARELAVAVMTAARAWGKGERGQA